MIMWDRVILNLRSAGLRQKDIAARLGVSTRAVQSWVAGDREPVDYRIVLPLLTMHYERCPDRHRVEVIGEP